MADPKRPLMDAIAAVKKMREAAEKARKELEAERKRQEQQPKP